MTITSTATQVSYAGDGTSTEFTIPFVFDTSADLKVIQRDADGNPVVLSSGYTITGGLGEEGTLTLTTALPNGETLIILDDPQRTQVADYIANDVFPAETHETALDRGVRISKRLFQLIQNSFRFSDGDPSAGDNAVLGTVDSRKGKYLFFNATTGAPEFASNLATTTLTQGVISELLYPQTAAEASGGVTPSDYTTRPVNLTEGDMSRYGAVADGVADDRAAFVSAEAVGDYHLTQGVYRIGSDITLSRRMYFEPGAILAPDSGVTVTIDGLIDGPGGSGGPFGGLGDVLPQNYNVTVGTDFATVQEAIDNSPKFLRQIYNVRLPAGTYDEDVVVEGIHAMRVQDPSAVGETARFQIVGDDLISQDPAVLLKSVMFYGCTGQGHTLANLTVYGTVPYVDEVVAVAVFGCPADVQITKIAIPNSTTADRGVLSYASNIRAEVIDFGTGLSRSAWVVKGGGFIKANNGNSGTVGEYVIEVTSGSAHINDMSEITYGEDRPVKLEEGFVRCDVSGELYGIGQTERPALNYYSIFESIDGYTQAGTGSAALTTSGTDGINLSTGTTSGSTYDIKKVFRRSLVASGFDEFRTFGVALNSSDFSDCVFYAVTGDLAGKYIGVKIDDGTLYGVCDDGTSETTVNLGAAPTTPRIFCKFWPGSKIEFFDNEIHKGDITTGLPSGSQTGSDAYAQFTIENTSAVDRDVRVCEWMIYKLGISVFN